LFTNNAHPHTFFVLSRKDNSVTKKKARDGEIFIPELCDIAPINHIMSSQMWLKATFLPTVIERIGHLLTAEQLRKSINQSVNIGTVDPPKGELCQE
jgi:hypothetical protein